MMCGLPMVGHAVWVPEMMCRNKPPICSIQDVIERSKRNNYKMICQAVATGDAKFDEKAWSKTQDELDRGIALLVDDWKQLTEMFGHDVVVAVRRAIWERHGNVIEWVVRVIDDFRVVFIDDACSYFSARRLATHGDVIASEMAAAKSC